MKGAMGRATLTFVLVFDDIPGRQAIADTRRIDATPEDFDRVWEELRLGVHRQVESPMRPCGHSGPWHRPNRQCAHGCGRDALVELDDDILLCGACSLGDPECAGCGNEAA